MCLAHKLLHPKDNPLQIRIDNKIYELGSDNVDLPIDVVYCGYGLYLDARGPSVRGNPITIKGIAASFISTDIFKERYLGKASNFQAFPSNIGAHLMSILLNRVLLTIKLK